MWGGGGVPERLIDSCCACSQLGQLLLGSFQRLRYHCWGCPSAFLRKEQWLFMCNIAICKNRTIVQDMTFIVLWDFLSHFVLIGCASKHNPLVRASLLGQRDCVMSLLPSGPGLFISILLSGSSLSWTFWTICPCSIFSMCACCPSYRKLLKVLCCELRGEVSRSSDEHLDGMAPAVEWQNTPELSSKLCRRNQNKLGAPAHGEQPTMPGFSSARRRGSLGK